MSKLAFDRKINRFELDNRCILLADEKNTPLAGLKTHEVCVKAGGKTYQAEKHDFYTDGKFFEGLRFPEGNDFFFEQQVSRIKHLKVSSVATETEGDKQVVHIEVYEVLKNS
jgi:hypothetical protein